MELSHCHLIKPNHIFTPLSIPKPKISQIHTKQSGFSLSKKYSKSMAMIACAKLGTVKESEQEDDEWAGIGESWREKCKGKGIVEVMECLEKEAIMGEDHGRETNDYKRRAHIFDKSNRVFQALKEKKSISEKLIS